MAMVYQPYKNQQKLTHDFHAASTSPRQSNFDSCLIAGPLAGFTCAPMRRLVWRYSNPVFCYAKMISAQRQWVVDMPTRFLYRARKKAMLAAQWYRSRFR